MDKLKDLLSKLKWIHVIILIAASIGWAQYMIDQSEIESREQGIVDAQKNLSNIKAKVAEAEAFQKEFEAKKIKYNSMVKALQEMQGALPKEFFLPELLSELLREAKQIGIEITAITPDPGEERKPLYNSLGFTIETKGTFIQIFIFMDRLSHMTRLMNVQSINFVKDGRPSVTLGGEFGSFAGSKFTGGRIGYPGVSSSIRVVTYRYRGGG